MRLLVDGVFYEIDRTGIARVWSSILPRLARYAGLDIVMLDRGNCPSIAGIEKVDFPTYRTHAYTAADSLLIDEVCKELRIDVFTSTYYTTPLTIPSVLVVHDMIPGRKGKFSGCRARRRRASGTRAAGQGGKNGRVNADG